jgi:hypothetical protein
MRENPLHGNTVLSIVTCVLIFIDAATADGMAERRSLGQASNLAGIVLFTFDSLRAMLFHLFVSARQSLGLTPHAAVDCLTLLGAC